MPPKTNSGASKKQVEKVKTKILEDKTFGLKNKKGSKQQKFIAVVQKQVSHIGQANAKTANEQNAEREKKRKEEEDKKREVAALFKPVMQTVAAGVDPKSVVCNFFKQGICQKGDRCKFSHDITVERKAEKRNLYADTRENDAMDTWDAEKLDDVINAKHGEDNKKKQTTTQIVCKYFIESVENKTYGWFWSCPNGDKCMYRHALPPGFQLKSESTKKSSDNEVSLELLIEKERASLGSKVTKVTLESFLAWKRRKISEKKDEIKKLESQKKNDFKRGFMMGLTGRDMFTFNPDLIADDDNDADDTYYKQREDDTDELAEARELNEEFFANQAKEDDGTGTIADIDRFAYVETMLVKELEDKRIRDQYEADAAVAAQAEQEGACGGSDGEEEDEDDDEELTEEDHKNSLKKLIEPNGKIEIDESLFNLDDLADLQDEIEDLDI